MTFSTCSNLIDASADKVIAPLNYDYNTIPQTTELDPFTIVSTVRDEQEARLQCGNIEYSLSKIRLENTEYQIPLSLND